MANTTITPAAGSARFTTNIVVGPLLASLLFSGGTSLLNLGIAPGTNSVGSGLLLTGNTPAINFNIVPPVVSISATGIAATLTYGSAPSIAAVNLIAQGFAPQLALGSVIPSSGSSVFVGAAPIVTIPNLTLTPDNSNYQLQGYAPLISGQQGSTSGSLTFTGTASKLGLNIRLTSAGVYSLIASGQIPLLNLTITVPYVNLEMTTAGQSPNLTPNTGIGTFQGNSVLPHGPVVANPGSGALIALGYISSEQLTVPAPPCAALVLGGQYPGVGQSYSIKLSSGSLIFSGTVPIEPVQSTVIIPPSVALSVSQTPPTLALNLQTFSASLSLSSVASVVSTGYVLTVQIGSGFYSGVAPSLTPGSSGSPNSATMNLSGIVPNIVSATVVSTSQMSLTGAAPLLGLGISPNVSSIISLGSAPSVNGKLIETIPTGISLVSGSSSVLNLGITPSSGLLSSGSSSGTANLNVISLSGSILISSDPSSVQLSGLPLTQTGSMTFSGFAPLVSKGSVVLSASLIFSSDIPIVNSLTSINPQTGNLSIGGVGPIVSQVGVIVPIENDLLISGYAPVLGRTGFAAPPVAPVLMIGQLPIVQSTTAGQIQPGSVDMFLTGQPAYILYYDPDTYYTVQVLGPAVYRVIVPG